MPLTIHAEECLEAGLLDLRGRGPEYGGGLANHGPMAAEALAHLGRPEQIGPWVLEYRRNLQDAPASRSRLRAAEWREALGRYDRVAEFSLLFEEELREAPWPEVLERWAERLAPGLAAAALHGLIRTAHAVRSLGSQQSAARLGELAQGLAYWAARYQPLPEAHVASGTGRLPSAALAGVPLLPAARRIPGLITEGLIALDGFPPFALVADAADATLDPASFVSDLTLTFARVCRDEAADFGRVIAFIHAVTGPSAARLLLPHVSPATARKLLRYAWQAAAGLYSAFSRAQGEARVEVPEVADLIDRAVATGDEHAIKLTEACLREHALRPDPVYLQAAAAGVRRIAAA